MHFFAANMVQIIIVYWTLLDIQNYAQCGEQQALRIAQNFEWQEFIEHGVRVRRWRLSILE